MLRGFDEYVNMVLDDVTEIEYTATGRKEVKQNVIILFFVCFWSDDCILIIRIESIVSHCPQQSHLRFFYWLYACMHAYLGAIGSDSFERCQHLYARSRRGTVINQWGSVQPFYIT